MNIFVGNLSLKTTENNIKSIFESFGLVTAVKMKIKEGQNSRGFGFVTMPNEPEAQAAINGLHEKEFMGRALIVTAERPKKAKPKKDYKEIKRLKQEAKTAVFQAPIIPEKKAEPRKKSLGPSKKFIKEDGSKEWHKRKGRGTSKPWKKKPGGVKKKFRHER